MMVGGITLLVIGVFGFLSVCIYAAYMMPAWSSGHWAGLFVVKDSSRYLRLKPTSLQRSFARRWIFWDNLKRGHVGVGSAPLTHTEKSKGPGLEDC